MNPILKLRKRNWLYEVIVGIEVLIIVAIGCLLVKPLLNGALLGSLLYFALSNTLRGMILKNHRRGINLMHNMHFSEAIEAFLLSNQFFTQHEWIDKYRYITMFMTSSLSYRQMSLFNVANCYAAMNRLGEAKMFFEQFLMTSPPSELAERTETYIAMIGEVMQRPEYETSTRDGTVEGAQC